MPALWQVRLAALRAELYTEHPEGGHCRLHQLVAGRSWVRVEKGGTRSWLKFYDHRDRSSLRVYDNATGDICVLQRVHVLDIWTMSENAVQLRMLCT
jgi:hypothetical protein